MDNIRKKILMVSKEILQYLEKEMYIVEEEVGQLKQIIYFIS